MSNWIIADGVPQKLLQDYNLCEPETTRYERGETEDEKKWFRFANPRMRTMVYVKYEDPE